MGPCCLPGTGPKASCWAPGLPPAWPGQGPTKSGNPWEREAWPLPIRGWVRAASPEWIRRSPRHALARRTQPSSLAFSAHLRGKRSLGHGNISPFPWAPVVVVGGLLVVMMRSLRDLPAQSAPCLLPSCCHWECWAIPDPWSWATLQNGHGRMRITKLGSSRLAKCKHMNANHVHLRLMFLGSPPPPRFCFHWILSIRVTLLPCALS